MKTDVDLQHLFLKSLTGNKKAGKIDPFKSFPVEKPDLDHNSFPERSISLLP